MSSRSLSLVITAIVFALTLTSVGVMAQDRTLSDIASAVASDSADRGPVTPRQLGEGTGTPEIHVEPTSVTIIEPGTRMWTPPPGSGELPPTGALEDHVPGRLIVGFEDNVVIDERSLTTGLAALDGLSSRLGLESMRPLIRSTPATAARHRQVGLDRIYVLEFPQVHDTRRLVAAYQGQPGIRFVEPDYIAYITQADPPGGERIVPDDPMYPLQWGLNNTGQAIPNGGGGPVGTPGADINAELAWTLSTGSPEVTVAILDTGVNPHAEFAGRMVPGYNFNGNNTNTSDVHGHGTAVAGIAAAAGNNGQGIAGVAWNVNIMPMRVCSPAGQCPTSDWVAAIIWSTDQGANVINLSLGGSTFSNAANDAVNYAHANGVAVFASTGNHNASSARYPAAYENSISVGALSPCNTRKTPSSCDGETWWGSGFGSGMDFLAPGTRIHTTDWGGDYRPTFNGTSAASPFAAGVGALVFSVNPNLTVDEVRAIMQSSATDMGTPGYNADTGFGRLNAGAALMATPGMGMLTITNVGEGTLQVTGISGDQPWLGVDPLPPFNLNAGESQEVEVMVDFAMLDEVQTGTLTIASNDPATSTVEVNVTAIPYLEPPEAVFTPSIEDGITATVEPAGTTTRTLNIANAGEHDLEFDFTDYVDGGRALMVRSEHLPLLDEALAVPNFSIQPSATHTTTAQGGIETQGMVVGFTFEGTVAGISGVGTWASDMSLTITGPAGQSFQVGGFTSGYPPWDFQGSGSTSDGTYTSTHMGVFDNVLDAGEWTFKFEHHWGSGVEMSWSDVTITLHKSGMPFVTDASPAAGTIAGGSSVDVTLTFDAGDLDLGTHFGAVSISTNEQGIGPRDYPVTLVVDGDPPGAPQASVSPGALDFTLPAGEGDTGVLTLSNVAVPGADDLAYSVTVMPSTSALRVLGPGAPAVRSPISARGYGGGEIVVEPLPVVPGAGLPALRAGDDVFLTHSNDMAITSVGSACAYSGGGGPSATRENNYWRVFDLSDFGVDGNLEVTTILHGAGTNTAANEQTFFFYVVEGELAWDNLELIGSLDVLITPDDGGEVLAIELDESLVVPAGARLAVRVHIPDSDGQFFAFAGFNWDGQTDYTYFHAPECNLPDPTPLEIYNPALTDLSWVFAVVGKEGGESPAQLVTVAPTDGSVPAGASTDLIVTVDSDGVAPGSYAFDILISTNDPDNEVLAVPVTVTVEAPAPPQAVVEPEELYFLLAPDATAEAALTLSNVAAAGAEALTFSVSIAGERPATAAPPAGRDAGRMDAGRASASRPDDSSGGVRSGMLSVDPTSGTISAGASIELTVTVDAGGLEYGASYDLEILIATNDPDKPVLTVPVEVATEPVGDAEGGAPLVFALEQNFPNPFSAQTTIDYSTAEAGPVTITVYDMTGRVVVTLLDAEMEAGNHTATWDASGVAAGVYFYRIRAGAFTQTQRALIVR